MAPTLAVARARPLSAPLARRAMPLACSGLRPGKVSATPPVPAGCRRVAAARCLQRFWAERSVDQKGRHGRSKQTSSASVSRVYHLGCGQYRFVRQDCRKWSKRTAPRRIRVARRQMPFAGARSVANVDDGICWCYCAAWCRTPCPPSN